MRMDNLKDLLCMELEELDEKTELTMGDLDLAHKLTDTVKNILKIEMYSGDYCPRTNYSGTTTAKSATIIGYSTEEPQGGGLRAISDHIQELMSREDIPDRDKEAMRRAMNQLR